MNKYINSDGEFISYRIHAAEGYVLHDNGYDTVKEQVVIDEETGEETITYIPVLGYHTSVASCGKNYDFSEITMQDDDGNTVTAYGSRQFFTKLASEVPIDQIFGNPK